MKWSEWGRLTRFHESSRLALAREQRLWSELELADADSAMVRVQNGERTYQATVAQHRGAIADEWLLNASILIYSYALAEAAAEEVLGPGSTDAGGIETWGTALLSRAGNSWDTVEGGQGGVVETAIVRNLLAHGEAAYTQSSLNRLMAVGGIPTWAPGDPLRLTYEDVLTHRARLKSLLRNGTL